MTSSQYGPYAWGRTRATMAGTEGRETARWSKPQRAGPSSDWSPGPSSDWSLQPDSMKLDSLVTAHQQLVP